MPENPGFQAGRSGRLAAHGLARKPVSSFADHAMERRVVHVPEGTPLGI
jgi:hypothetical protein